MKIVLVDDENITVRWLKKNIESINPGYEVIGAFQNGAEALEFICENDVDVLFTDIRMPLMDGMELLHKIKQQNKIIYIVILSAYDSFSYAREALQLQVNDFILKPEITREMLEKIFVAAETYLQKKIPQSNPRQKLSEEQNQYILDVLDRNIECTEEICKRAFSDLKIEIKSDNILIVNIYVKAKDIISKILDIVEFCIQEIKVQGVLVVRSEQRYYVIISSRIEEKVRKQTEMLLSSLKDFGGSDVLVGVSRIESRYTKLPELFRQTVVAMEQLMFYDRSGMLKYDQLSEITSNLMYKKVLERYQLKIKDNITSKIPVSKEYITDFLDEINQGKNVPHALVKTMIYDLLNTYPNEIKNVRMQSQDLSEIFQINDYESLKRFAKETEQAYLSTLGEAVCKEKHSYTVNRILDYLQLHYNTGISLQDIAEEVHMNRTYISSLFKKEMGEGINQYLFRLRIEQAKRLLASGDASMQQIALETGFGDGAYFSKMFKKATGKTPAEYRRMQNNVKKAE